MKADVTSPLKVRRMREDTGPVDILVNNAGIPTSGFALKKFVDSNPEDWEGDMRLNLGAVLHVTHAYVGAMVEHGLGPGRDDRLRRGPARRADAGDLRLGEGRARWASAAGSRPRWAPPGVTVNCVALGAMKTGPLAAAIEADPDARAAAGPALPGAPGRRSERPDRPGRPCSAATPPPGSPARSIPSTAGYVPAL